MMSQSSLIFRSELLHWNYVIGDNALKNEKILHEKNISEQKNNFTIKEILGSWPGVALQKDKLVIVKLHK